VFPDKSGDVSLLGRRTPASHNGGEFGGNLDEFVGEQIQAKLGMN
jgi:hypothetical protein